MTDKKRKIVSTGKWNTRFHNRKGWLKIYRKNINLIEIRYRNIYSGCTKRVADLLENELICEKCRCREDSIEMINPDEGMIVAVGLENFLREAFRNEGYSVTFED